MSSFAAACMTLAEVVRFEGAEYYNFPRLPASQRHHLL
jgi:hypothetical protein